MRCFDVPVLSCLSRGFLTAAILLPLISFAQEIRIRGGIVPYQVLQRGVGNRSSFHLTGTAHARFEGRSIEVRLTSQEGAVLTGFDWTLSDGRVKAGKWEAEIEGVPAGGPYVVEVRIAGMPAAADRVEHVLVGDLWVLAGQSNMLGYGNLIDVQPPVEAVHSFDMADNWVVAKEPLHKPRSSAYRIYWPKNEKGEPERWTAQREGELIARTGKGSGLGLPFAVELYRRSGVPIGLIPCALGGTSMDQWNPEFKDRGGDSLYGAALGRINAVGGKVRGILWYQGEADASLKTVAGFEKKFENLVAAFRNDLNQPALPVYYVQIGRYVNDQLDKRYWNQVQELQRQMEAKLTNVSMAASVDLELDDQIHISTPELKRLGRRLALLAARDLFAEYNQNAAIRRGPRPVSARLDNGIITLQLGEVNGKLLSEGRISGFSVHDARGNPLAAIYKARFDPVNPSVIHLEIAGKLPDGATLQYGAGINPYCNVRDSSDMALPAFGPIVIAR